MAATAIQLTPEQIAAFKPDATAAPGAPPPIQLTPEQMAQFRPDPAPAPAAPTPPPAPAKLPVIAELEAKLAESRSELTPSRTDEEDLGALDAAGRSASNIFGLGPALSAIQQKALSVIPGMPAVDYSEARQQAQEALERSQAQHPVAALAGLAPRVVVETSLGSGAASVAGKVAPQLAAKVAALPSTAQHAATGAAYGAASAGGEAISREKPPEEALADVARGTVLGGAVGRVLGPAAERLVKGAEGRADDWITKEIIGDEGKAGSTGTTRKQLSQDAADVKDVVKLNPDLKKAIAEGINGKPEAIERAADVNQQHIDRVFGPKNAVRNKLHAEADTFDTTTLGDALKHIDDHIDQLAKKTNTRNVRKALDAVKEDWKEVYGGGAKRVIDPGAEIGPGVNAKTAYDKTAARLERTTDPDERADLQTYLDDLMAAHGKVETWDPKAPISSVQLRDSLNAAAATVENTMGALNEKISFGKAQDLARPVYDIYDAHIARVAKKNPELADGITEMERQGAAHLRIKKVLEERGLKAEEKHLAGSAFDLHKMGHHPGAEGAAVAAGTGHFGRAAALWATTGIPRLIRASDKALAALTRQAAHGPISPAAAAVAAKAGVPPHLIDRIMRGAARATVRGITQVAPRAAATVPGSEERRSVVGGGGAALPAAALGALFPED